jgi:MFS family permease
MLTGFVGGLASLFVVRVMLGLGEGATFPTATRAMTSWTAKGQRGYAQGITHSFARLGNAITPPLVAVLMAWVTWRGSFVILGLVSLVWIFVWVLYFRNDPAAHRGVTKEELAELLPYDERGTTGRNPVPWRRLLARMAPTTIVYFCYGWTLWLYLTWLPSFFVQAHGLNIKNSALFSFGVFLAGVIGDTVGGIVSDRVLRRTGDLAKARRNVIILGLVGSLVCLVPVLFAADLVLIAACLSAAFFFLELTIGPIWSVPMDIAPQHSGSASGIMNTGSAVAAIVSPLAFGWITDVTGSFTLPFLVSIGLLLLGAILSFWMRPDRKLVDDAASAPNGGAARGIAVAPLCGCAEEGAHRKRS